MAATVSSTDRLIDATMGGGPGSRDGNGFHKNGGGGAEDGHPLRFSPARYRIGVWVAISSILMLFVALSSSYIVRSASGDDWRPIVMPKVLWFSTAVILVSSFTMEVSRRSLKAFNDAGYGRWLAIRSEEHTSELQSQSNLVCRLLLEKKKQQIIRRISRSLLLFVVGPRQDQGFHGRWR